MVRLILLYLLTNSMMEVLQSKFTTTFGVIFFASVTISGDKALPWDLTLITVFLIEPYPSVNLTTLLFNNGRSVGYFRICIVGDDFCIKKSSKGKFYYSHITLSTDLWHSLSMSLVPTNWVFPILIWKLT